MQPLPLPPPDLGIRRYRQAGSATRGTNLPSERKGALGGLAGTYRVDALTSLLLRSGGNLVRFGELRGRHNLP